MGFGRYSCTPRSPMGMTDTEKGASWRPRSGVRQLACCSLSQYEYGILLLEQEGRETRLQVAAGSLNISQRYVNGFKDFKDTEMVIKSTTRKIRSVASSPSLHQKPKMSVAKNAKRMSASSRCLQADFV